MIKRVSINNKKYDVRYLKCLECDLYLICKLYDSAKNAIATLTDSDEEMFGNLIPGYEFSDKSLTALLSIRDDCGYFYPSDAHGHDESSKEDLLEKVEMMLEEHKSWNTDIFCIYIVPLEYRNETGSENNRPA